MTTTTTIQKPKRVTLNAVNAAIRAAGGTEELVRGEGYFYFIGGSSVWWDSVPVYHLTALSIDEWVAEWRDRRDADNRCN